MFLWSVDKAEATQRGGKEAGVGSARSVCCPNGTGLFLACDNHQWSRKWNSRGGFAWAPCRVPVQVTPVLVLYFPLGILWAAVHQPEGSIAWLRTFPECLLWNIFKGFEEVPTTIHLSHCIPASNWKPDRLWHNIGQLKFPSPPATWSCIPHATDLPSSLERLIICAVIWPSSFFLWLGAAFPLIVDAAGFSWERQD